MQESDDHTSQAVWLGEARLGAPGGGLALLQMDHSHTGAPICSLSFMSVCVHTRVNVCALLHGYDVACNLKRRQRWRTKKVEELS